MENERILESWKEISGYLNRSIKTCQRWELELDLPIHRLDGTPRARVYAYPEELDRWMSEKLHHLEQEEARQAEAAPASPPRRRWVPAAAGAALFAAAAAGAFWWLAFGRPVTFPRQTPCVIFLPLENVEGDPTLEEWRTALPYLISMDLVQSRAIGSWNQGDLFLQLSDLKLWDVSAYSDDDLKRIGDKIRCDRFVTGRLDRSGEDIVLDLTMKDPGTLGVLATFRTLSKGEQGLWRMVDDLSKDVKRAMNIPRRMIAQDVDEDIADITTSSPAAFKLFCKADRLTWLGDTHEASVLYQRAVEADPQFAEAYFGLFRSSRGSQAKDEVLRIGRKTVEFASRLNIWSRYNFLGDFYQNFDRDYDKAMAAYQTLWKLQEDDLSGYSMGQILVDLEDYGKAVPILEAIRYKVKINEGIVRLLARCYAGAGDVEKAVAALDENLGNDPESSPRIIQQRAILAAERGEAEVVRAMRARMRANYPNAADTVEYGPAPALITADDLEGAEAALRGVAAAGQAAEKAQALLALAGISSTRGRIGEARERARSALEAAEGLGNPALAAAAHLSLAHLERLSGDLTSALAHAEAACRSSEGTGVRALGALHLRALLDLEAGRMEEAEKQAEDIKDLVRREKYPKLMRVYYHLLGHRELLTGDTAKALDHFWKALNLLPSPAGKSGADIDSVRYYYDLVEAYWRSGAHSRALQAYKDIPSYWEQRTNSGDVYARSFFLMARCLEGCSREFELKADEQASLRAQAADHYRKFLSLFGEADPRFAADVEDARIRLAGLSPGSR